MMRMDNGKALMNILVVEASTTSAKTLLYYGETGSFDVHQIKYPASVNDVKTQDMNGVIKTVFKCAKELMQARSIDIDMIALASVWHSYVLLDEDEKPIGRVRTWADTEAAQSIQQYKNEQSKADFFYQRSGCNIHSKYPCWKWFHDTQTLNTNNKKEIKISSVPEYMFKSFTGESAVSKNVASGSGFFNIHSLEWDDEILSFVGAEKVQLSVLKEYDYCGRLTKNAAEQLGCKQGIPVLITGADGAMNQVGEGALSGGIMTMSVGTSSAIRLPSDVPVLPKQPATWCYYVGEGKRLIGAATASGGNCVDWFVDNVLINTVGFGELEKALENVVQSAAPVFLPFLYGEQSPGWNDSRLGEFASLNGGHDVFDMYYSVLEGILFNIYHCFTFLSELMERPKEIRISGGIVNSDFWTQLAADIFQIPIKVSKAEHGSMMGALTVAKKVSGMIECITGYKCDAGRVVRPRAAEKDVAAGRYKRYLEYYNTECEGVSY